MSDLLIKAEHVSKKFCRSLKRSLWYGVKDVAHSLNPWSRSREMDGDGSLRANVDLRQDEFWALQDINFEVRRGECLGLIGHNGAGKSTLLKILNNLIRPDSGRITMRGRVGAMIELGAGFNPVLSGRENIYNQAALLGFETKEIKKKFDAIVDFSELEQFLDMPLQNYSSGMRVKLGFAVASQMEPDILLLDEILAVGDVGFRFKCLNVMGELQRKTAMIFVSHSMTQVHRICQKVILLSGGCVTYSGFDVAVAVRSYMGLVKTTQGIVVGSGEAEIVDLKIQTVCGTCGFGKTVDAEFGGWLRVTARIRIQTKQYPVLRMEFLLWNEDMMPVMELMAKDLLGYAFDLPDSDEIEITAFVARSELNAGRYSLSALITDESHTNVLCNYVNAAYLRVNADGPSGAHILSVAKWNIETKSREHHVVESSEEIDANS